MGRTTSTKMRWVSRAVPEAQAVVWAAQERRRTLATTKSVLAQAWVQGRMKVQGWKKTTKTPEAWMLACCCPR